MAEGIGIDRLTANFANARVDGAFQCTDRETVEMAYFLQSHDGIFIGPSAALNVVGAVKLARLLGYVAILLIHQHVCTTTAFAMWMIVNFESCCLISAGLVIRS